jgi:hypothetical protein
MVSTTSQMMSRPASTVTKNPMVLRFPSISLMSGLYQRGGNGRKANEKPVRGEIIGRVVMLFQLRIFKNSNHARGYQ